MALPWGSTSSSAPAQLGAARAEINVVPFETGSSSRSLFNFVRPAPRFSIVEGAVVGAPGAAYQIEVVLMESTRPSSSLRVVRASINGTEINEQLILKGGGERVKFVGWLDSPDGTKRVHFTFPASGEITIQVGIFEATAAAGGDGKKGGATSAPAFAQGNGFRGPQVSTAQFVIGEPVAIAAAKLRALPDA